MKIAKLMIAACLVSLAVAAQAHGPDKGKNGGQQADAGSYHVEAVAKDTELSVYVSDQGDKAVSTKGFKGTAILVVDGKPLRITLSPQGENMLAGNSSVALKTPIRGAIQITTNDNVTAQAKF